MYHYVHNDLHIHIVRKQQIRDPQGMNFHTFKTGLRETYCSLIELISSINNGNYIHPIVLPFRFIL